MKLSFFWRFTVPAKLSEPPRDKTNKMACAPSEDSDQPGHPPSLFRLFAVRMKKCLVLSYPLSALRGSAQTGRMCRLSWVFAGRTVILLVLSWGGSFTYIKSRKHERGLCSNSCIFLASSYTTAVSFLKVSKMDFFLNFNNSLITNGFIINFL